LGFVGELFGGLAAAGVLTVVAKKCYNCLQVKKQTAEDKAEEVRKKLRRSIALIQMKQTSDDGTYDESQECPVCKVQPTTVSLVPCDHPYCVLCVLRLLDSKFDSVNDVLCPTCRTPFTNIKSPTAAVIRGGCHVFYVLCEEGKYDEALFPEHAFIVGDVECMEGETKLLVEASADEAALLRGACGVLDVIPMPELDKLCMGGWESNPDPLILCVQIPNNKERRSGNAQDFSAKYLQFLNDPIESCDAKLRSVCDDGLIFYELPKASVEWACMILSSQPLVYNIKALPPMPLCQTEAVVTQVK